MILVCGDRMIDRYVYGDVKRLSPDAPVPIVNVEREEEREGAAANVANNVRSMGGECIALFGTGAPVVKVRILGKNQHVVRLDYDHLQTEIDPYLFREECAKVQYVVFCDYWKGSLRNIARLIKMAKEMRKFVLVDPKGHDWSRYEGADLIKPNIDEMRELVGGWSTEDELHEKADKLLEKMGAILLTRGADGMTLYRKSGRLHVMAESTEVRCVSGAGEAVIAAMAVALSKGYFMDQAVHYASKAAGLAIQRFGTSLVMEEEVFAGRTLKSVG